MRRMDRYEDEIENPNSRVSRENRNKDLYTDVSRNARYASYKEVANANQYDISKIDRSNRTRENYQKIREYSNSMPETKTKRDLEDFRNIYRERENRVYDINSVMAEARKNRTGYEEEKRRKLKNDKYNILLSMTKEELDEYRKARKQRFIHPDEEQIREVIDTIASKTLAGELDKNTTVNLLSELMATSIMDKVESPMKEEVTDEIKAIEKEIEKELESKNIQPVKMEYTNTKVEVTLDDEDEEDETDEIEKIVTIEDDNQDRSFVTDEPISQEQLRLLSEKVEEKVNEEEEEDFFTKSMDLKDLEEDMDDEFKDNSLPGFVKFFIFLIIVAILAVAGYYIYQMI